MSNGYMNRFLFVDLSRKEAKPVPVPEPLKNQFAGGKGFGARLLYDLCPEGADPLGPDNPLIFMTGPLTSTSAPAMRACVVTKSPSTGLYLDSYFGGRFGPEIKYAGFDGLIIAGRSEKPVYLWISDQETALRPAEAIWGTDSLEANRRIKADLNDSGACVATIGQAGENRSALALINCEYNRQAGRGGAGAVMGAKNLKGIAVKGMQLVRTADPDAFKTACRDALREIRESEACAELTEFGTSAAVSFSAEIGTLPYRNYLSQSYGKADKIGAKGQAKHLFLGKSACFGCPIRCSQMGAVRTGKHAHFITDTVEYETVAMLGSNLDISDVRAVAHLTRLCDLYGMDTISAGGVIAFAFEAAEKGIIEPPEGVELKFGSSSGAEFIIESMAFRKGPIGELLADGVQHASRKLGQHTEDFAIQIKGLECPGFAPRGTPGMGLAYMTADRGACHQRGFMVGYELGGEPYKGESVEADALSGKARILKERQDYLAGTDALVKCDFGAMGVSPGTYARLFSAATGRNVTESFFDRLGERIWNQTRMFNLREGMTYKDERLPGRIIKEAVPDGPLKGKIITEADMIFLREDYYRVRGWDREGRPTPETLERLGIRTEPLFSV